MCSLKGEKNDFFLIAIIKKYSSCRKEVILYEIFTTKYQKFSIKFILTTVNHKLYLLNTFFLPCKYFSDIYIIVCMKNKYQHQLIKIRNSLDSSRPYERPLENFCWQILFVFLSHHYGFTNCFEILNFVFANIIESAK